MHNYMAVVRSDIRNTFRDPVLSVILLLIPLIIVLVLRFAFPLLLEYLPLAINYRKEIVSFFALICAIMPGFVMAFILLDEKDINLFPAMKVTPVSLSGFLMVRLVLVIAIGFALSMLILAFNGICLAEWAKMAQYSVLAALNSPILVLLIAHFAKNKIEGVTLLKATNILLLAPLLVFFFQADWEYLLAIFPAFWAYKFFDTSNSLAIFCIGSFYLVSLNCAAFRFVNRKM